MGRKKGAAAASSYIMWITVLVISIGAITALTTQVFVPGLKTAQIVEEKSLAFELASSMNALSLEESGEVEKIFTKEYLLETGREGEKYFISIGDEKVFTNAKLKDIVLETTDRIKIVKNFDDDFLEVLV